MFGGGLLLIALGITVLLVRERLRVADEERLLAQRYQRRLEKARAQSMAVSLRAAEVKQAMKEAGDAFEKAFEEE